MLATKFNIANTDSEIGGINTQILNYISPLQYEGGKDVYQTY